MNFQRDLLFYEYKGYIDESTLSNETRGVFSKGELDYLKYISATSFRNGEIFSFGPNSIRANNYVGTIAYGGRQLTILPKLLSTNKETSIIENLSYMLEFTDQIPISDFDRSLISQNPDSFLEVYLAIFAQKLSELLKRNFPKQYIEREDNLYFVRGKVVHSENLRKNSINHSKTFCRFDEFSGNNSVSQLFKSACVYTIRKTKNARTFARLRECLKTLYDVDTRQFSKAEIEAISVTRMNSHFDETLRLAKSFLLMNGQAQSRGRSNFSSIVFDMNTLFEEFVYRFLLLHRKALGIREIVPQRGKRVISNVFDLDENDYLNKTMMNSYVDLFLIFDDGSNMIIDTKYKLLDHTGDRHFNISNSDIYQISAYERLYAEDDNPPSLCLMYPENLAPVRLRLDLNGELAPVYIQTINLHQDLRLNSKVLLEEFRRIFHNMNTKQSLPQTA